MQHTDVLVLGGGAAGLACMAGLSDQRDTMLLEREDEVGGLLRVHPAGDYVFDTTVHVLFFRNPQLLEAVLGLLPEGVHRFERKNLIWQAGSTIPYPYQFNAHALPDRVREACIGGFLDNPHGKGPVPEDFRGWLLNQFGPGFYEHFFGPYNRKLYGVHPEELEAAPLLWLIPADNDEAIREGATAPPRNPPTTHCFYPRGPRGIHAVAAGLRDLARGPILCGREVVRIEPAQRCVTTADGRQVRYRSLVNSLPLPVLLGLIDGLPPALAGAMQRLRAQSVTMLHIGARRSGDALPAHWTYFPDPEVPFYRMTRLEQITPDMCPEGATALMLECPGTEVPEQDKVLDLLTRLGVLRERGDVDEYRSRVIPYAYVLFLKGFRETVNAAMGFLDECGIHSTGRYGGWQYLNIEKTIESGLQVARRLTPPNSGTSNSMQRFGLA